MKKIYYLLLGLMLVLSTTLVSCSDDDNPSSEPSNSSPIEGIWMHKFKVASEGIGVSFYIFNNDRSGYSLEFDDDDGYTPGGTEDLDPFRYAYDEKNNKIIMIDDEGQWEYIIKNLTADVLTWIDLDSNKERTYIKYNGTLDDIKKEYDVDLYVDDNNGANKDDDENNNYDEEEPDYSGSGYIRGYEYVDLGLPSGTMWAAYNVGASSPEGYGDYYAWGETTTKSDYSESNYQYHNGSEYVNIGSNICGTRYDVARAQWGGSWRMHSEAEFEELIDRCTWTWTTYNGINGYKVTGPNGKSIFLPATGHRNGTELYGRGSDGYYWSGSLVESGQSGAYGLSFDSGDRYIYSGFREYGLTVRPVMKFSNNNDDDNPSSEPSNSSPIEGIWMHKFKVASEGIGVSFYIFNNDRSGYSLEFDDDDGYTPGGTEDLDPFRYAYDEKNNKIIMIDDEGQWEYIIKNLTADVLTWIDLDSNKERTYIKYNGTLDDIKKEYDVELYIDYD